MAHSTMATGAIAWFKHAIISASATAAAGIGIGVLAFLTARYGPAGSNWSFRGNGALAVYTTIPAVLAAGWTAVALRYRGQREWAVRALAAGSVALVLAALDALLIPLFGVRADQTFGPVLLLALGAWTFLAPVLALRLAIPSAGEERTPVGLALVEAAAAAVGLIMGLAAITVVLPPGS